MSEGVVRNGLWYPDDRDWVEVVDGKTPEQIIGCGAQEWTYLSFSERESRSFDGDGAIYVKPGEFLFGSEDVVAVLDLRPKPQLRKDHGPSADTQARDWCHQQWKETERELRKANAYILALEAEKDVLRREAAMWRSRYSVLQDELNHDSY